MLLMQSHIDVFVFLWGHIIFIHVWNVIYIV